MQDLRTILYALADQLADRGQPAKPDETAAHNSAFATACEDFVRGLAKGDLALSAQHGLSDSEHKLLREALNRVKNLLQIAKESAAGTVQRTDTIIHSMESLANASNHQRTLINRSIEDLRPVALRLQDLALQCAELSMDADRTALLALNTGIEGLRVGGEVARALGALGEEIRRLAQRESLVARAVSDALKMHKGTIQRSTEHLDDASATLRVILEQVSTASAAAESVRVVDEALSAAAGSFRMHDSESQVVIDQLQDLTHSLGTELLKAQELVARNPSSREAVQAALAQLALAAKATKL